MRTISFESMFRILEDCAAMVWGDMRMIVYPAYWLPEESDGGIFLHLEGVDSDFNEYEVNFKEKDNKNVQVEGKFLYLIDTNGNKIEIQPLFAKNLSEYQ